MNITLEQFDEWKCSIYLNSDGSINYQKGCLSLEEEEFIHPFIEDNIIDFDGEEAIDWPGVWGSEALVSVSATRRKTPSCLRRAI